MFHKNTILYVLEEISVPNPQGRGRGTTFKFGQQVTVVNDFTEQKRGHVVKLVKENSNTAYHFSPVQINKYFTWDKKFK